MTTTLRALTASFVVIRSTMAALDHVASVVDTSCMVLCRGMPAGSVVGVDAFAVTVPSRDFAGFRLVPPGPHFLYSTSHPDVPRACCFVYLEPRSVHALVWSREDEALVADAAVADALGDGVDAARRAHLADPTLVVFPNDQHAVGQWRSVTWALTPRTLAAIHSPLRAAVPRAAGAAVVPATAADGGLPSSTASSSITWTPVPGVGTGAEPAARTAYAIDTSAALRSLLARAEARMASAPAYVTPAATAGSTPAGSGMPPPAAVASLTPASRGLLAELQAAFLSFLVGHDLQALEQWKHVTDVLCRCEDALAGRRVLPHAFDGAAEEPAASGDGTSSATAAVAAAAAAAAADVHVPGSATTAAAAPAAGDGDGDAAAGDTAPAARSHRPTDVLASDAIPDRLSLFACALATLHAQLAMLPVDFFASSGAGGADAGAAAAAVGDAAVGTVDGGDVASKAQPAAASGRAPAGPFIIASLARLQEVATQHADAAGAGLADSVRGLVALARDRFSLDIPSPRLPAQATAVPAAGAASGAPAFPLAGAAGAAAGGVAAAAAAADIGGVSRPAATAPLRPGEFASMDELLAALREEGGDDDLPTIV